MRGYKKNVQILSTETYKKNTHFKKPIYCLQIDEKECF